MTRRPLWPLLALLLLVAVGIPLGCSGKRSQSVTTPSTGGTSALPVLPPLDIYPPGYLAENQAVTLSFEPSDEKPVRTVYRLIRRESTQQYAEEMAQKLGVKGNARKDDSAESLTYTVQDENASVSVTEGCFMYVSSHSGATPAPGLTEANAGDGAKSFLSERGLMPPDAIFGEASRSQDGSISVGAGNKSFPTLFAVFPIFPPFSISFSFDPQGSLDDIIYCWPDLEPVGDYPLLSEREAHQSALSNGTESAPGATVTINSFVLSYFTSTDAEGTTSYLVPVYCAMGVRHRESGEDETGCIAPVPAIPESQMRRGYPDWAPASDTPTP